MSQSKSIFSLRCEKEFTEDVHVLAITNIIIASTSKENTFRDSGKECAILFRFVVRNQSQSKDTNVSIVKRNLGRLFVCVNILEECTVRIVLLLLDSRAELQQ